MPLRVLVRDALGGLLAFDSRILRTLWPLFLRPGFLTAEWCRGRRVPYVPPLRLYLFVAAVFFLVLAATDSSFVEIDVDEVEEELATAETAAEGAALAGGESAVPETSPEGGWWDRLLKNRLGPALMQDPEVLEDRFVDRLGRLSLLLPPVFGLLLALVYRRRPAPAAGVRLDSAGGLRRSARARALSWRPGSRSPPVGVATNERSFT